VIFFKCWSHVHFWTYQSHLSRTIGLGSARKNVIPPPLMLINLAIFLNFFPSNYGYWNLQKHMILLFKFFYYIAMILTLSYLKKSFSTFGYSAWNNVYKFWQFFLHFFFPLIMDIENLKKHMILALLMWCYDFSTFIFLKNSLYTFLATLLETMFYKSGDCSLKCFYNYGYWNPKRHMNLALLIFNKAF
jgi:hypothetical protein